MPTKKLPPTINAALKMAQDNLGDVPKDSTNSFHKYKYTSSEQMISSCRDALLAGGLVFSELGSEIVEVCEGVVVARVSYRLNHPESGESFEWSRDFPIVPEKGRPLDKAFCGSLTSGMNYGLRGLLLVPRVDPSDEMDSDSRLNDSTSKPSKPSRQTKKSRPASDHDIPSGENFNGSGFESKFGRGDTVETSNGNVGSIFWIGGDKGDRVGVQWGEGADEKEWPYLRFLKPASNGGGPPVTAGPPPHDDSEIPY